jgi:hypothetical protein
MSVETLEALKSRIATFFKVQPFGVVVGLGELELDLSEEELKKIISADDAEKWAKKAEKAGTKTEGLKKSEVLDLGRRTAVNDAIDALKKDGLIVWQKNEEQGGMGWRYNDSREESQPEKIKLERLPLDQIRIDKALQQREDGTDPKTVREYADVADLLPPIRVYHWLNDEKKDVYLLARGFHRIEAWKLAGWDMVPCEIVEGDREAAILDAVGDNASHGKRRKDADVRKAVATILGMRKYKNAAIAWIAETVHCSWATAAKYAKAYRRERAAENGEEEEDTGTVRGKDGRSYPTNIGPKSTADAPPANGVPPATAPAAASTGVKDRTGAEIVDPDVARAFQDTRFFDAVRACYQQVKYLRDFRTDGVPVSALGIKERETILADIERSLDTLSLSGMYAQLPANTDKVTPEAKRRRWLTQAEFQTLAKGTKPRKNKGGKESDNGKAAESTSQTETSNA